jgi:hypothetical protein
MVINLKIRHLSGKIIRKGDFFDSLVIIGNVHHNFFGGCEGEKSWARWLKLYKERIIKRISRN